MKFDRSQKPFLIKNLWSSESHKIWLILNPNKILIYLYTTSRRQPYKKGWIYSSGTSFEHPSPGGLEGSPTSSSSSSSEESWSWSSSLEDKLTISCSFGFFGVFRLPLGLPGLPPVELCLPGLPGPKIIALKLSTYKKFSHTKFVCL